MRTAKRSASSIGAGTEPDRLRPEFRTSEVDTEILERHCRWSGSWISRCWGRLFRRRQAQTLHCVERHILKRTVHEVPAHQSQHLVTVRIDHDGRRRSPNREGLRYSPDRYGSIESRRSGSDSIGKGRFQLVNDGCVLTRRIDVDRCDDGASVQVFVMSQCHADQLAIAVRSPVAHVETTGPPHGRAGRTSSRARRTGRGE